MSPPKTSSTAQAALTYILAVISTAEAIKPNYHAAALQTGHASARVAQMKFKKLIEQNGFKLINGAVVSQNATSSTAGTGVKSEAERGRKRKASPGDLPVTKQKKVEAEKTGAAAVNALDDSEGQVVDDAEGAAGGDEEG